MTTVVTVPLWADTPADAQPCPIHDGCSITTTVTREQRVSIWTGRVRCYIVTTTDHRPSTRTATR